MAHPQVMPEGEHRSNTQKVCAGDLTGVVQCFSVRKGEIGMAFKTLPTPDKVRVRTCVCACT